MNYGPKFTPKHELIGRVNKLQKLMVDGSIEAAIITDNADLIYFAGTMQSSHLYIPAVGEPLLIAKRIFERAQAESSLEKIVPIKSPRELPEIIKSEGYQYPAVIGMELDVLPANNYFFYQKILAPAQLVDVSALIGEVRSVKSLYELDLLKQSASLMVDVYKEVPNILKEGMTEVEVAAEIERLARRKGHQGHVRLRSFNQEIYWGQFSSGVTTGTPTFWDGPLGGQGLSAAFPMSCGHKKIRAGEPILLDYCGVKDGYIVDLTRNYAIGTLPEKLIKAFEASLNIQTELINYIKVGVTSWEEAYFYALELARETQYGDTFLGYPKNQVKFVGHGVGLELDELPVLAKGFKQKILPGMVMAIEPKFAFPELGGIGIENTWVAGEKKLEKITLVPDEMVII